MKITKVSVKRLFSLPDYQHVQFGYEAEVEENETSEEVKLHLVDKVQSDFNTFNLWRKESAERHKKERIEREAKWREERITDHAKRLKQMIEKMEKFLDDHGVTDYTKFRESNDFSEYDDLPF